MSRFNAFARTVSSPSRALAAFALLALSVPAARASPAFGRAEAAPCARCHVSAPVLNAAGERFMASGYRAAAAPAHRADEAPPLPVGARIEAGLAYSRADTASARGARPAHTEGGFREYLLELDAAGRAGGNVSFRLVANLDSAASAVRAPVAFVQFGDLVRGGALAHLSLRAGVFDAGLPFVSAERRPTQREYLAPVEVDAHGLELIGTHAAWDWAIGQMNSDRTGAGSDGRGFNRLEDTYVRLVRALGGQAVGARLLFDRQDSDIPKHAWLQRLRAQVAGRFGSDRLAVVPGYVLDRYDDRPAAGYHERHQYAMLEALAVLGAEREWTAVGRFEHEHTTPVGSAPGEERDLEVLRVGREVTPLARVALEWSRAAVTSGGPRESRVDALVQLAY